MDQPLGPVGHLLPELPVRARRLRHGRLPHRLRAVEGGVESVGELPFGQQRDEVQEALEVGGRLAPRGAGDGEHVLTEAARLEVDREGAASARRDGERLDARGQGALAQAQPLTGVGDVDAGAERPRSDAAEALGPGRGAAAATGRVDDEIAVQLLGRAAAQAHAGHAATVVRGEETADGALLRSDAGQCEHAPAQDAFEQRPRQPQGARLVDARAERGGAVGVGDGLVRGFRLVLGAQGRAGGQEFLAQPGQELPHPRLAEGQQAVDGPALGDAAARCERRRAVGRERIPVDDRDLPAVRSQARRREQPRHGSAHHDRVVKHSLQPPACRRAAADRRPSVHPTRPGRGEANLCDLCGLAPARSRPARPAQVPAMPVVEMPLMIWRWKNRKTTISGSAARTAWAMFCAYWMP